MRRYDVAIVGSGFAGSILAMTARRVGLSVALLERRRHPRFAIGESTTPLTNLLLEEIADEFDLPLVRSFSKWGTWRQAHSDIACGLKRGFTFFHHEFGREFPRGRHAARRNQLMVGASPADRVADTHWYRAEFDAYLARQAAALGADYQDDAAIDRLVEEPDGIRIAGVRGGRPFAATAGFLVDATGPRGFLHRALRRPETPIAGYPPTQGLFTHFEGVAKLPGFFTPGEPPYPPEQAAVHHVFDGGWVWVLQFNNGITSAGVAATDPLAERWQLRAGESGWRNLLRDLPSLAAVFAAARPVLPFTWQPRIAFQSDAIAGARWALLPSAAGIVDPLLSTGFPLTLLGIQRLARLFRHFGNPEFSAGLADYTLATRAELALTAKLVAALYARMSRFDEFKDLILLYFAAASFSEAARRLGKPRLAPGFLLSGNPEFAAQLRELTDLAPGDPSLRRRVREVIAPFDVAGLGDHRRDPWYPANPADLLRHADKLGVAEADVRAMLARCGLAFAGSSTSAAAVHH